MVVVSFSRLFFIISSIFFCSILSSVVAFRRYIYYLACLLHVLYIYCGHIIECITFRMSTDHSFVYIWKRRRNVPDSINTTWLCGTILLYNKFINCEYAYKCTYAICNESCNRKERNNFNFFVIHCAFVVGIFSFNLIIHIIEIEFEFNSLREVQLGARDSQCILKNRLYISM